jgi:hypothetical protein
VLFPRTPDPLHGNHTVLIGGKTYGFVHMCTLNSCLIVLFPPLYRFMKPSGSAPKEGDNVTAKLHVMCPALEHTHFNYSQLATSRSSLAIILS